MLGMVAYEASHANRVFEIGQFNRLPHIFARHYQQLIFDYRNSIATRLIRTQYLLDSILTFF